MHCWFADTELYWFVCFNAAADAPTSTSPAAWQQEALGVVQGWAWGLPEVVQATPLQDLSRSRLLDRWAAAWMGRWQLAAGAQQKRGG